MRPRAAAVAGLLAAALSAAACGQESVQPEAKPGPAKSRAPLPDEKHLRAVRQLTFHGENAEAYFSAAGDRLVFQSRPGGESSACDQIHILGVDGRPLGRISSGEGRTTCAYFVDGDRRVIYASTHLAGKDCPPAPRPEGRRYVWPVYRAYDIFSLELARGTLSRLTTAEGYDAEATASSDGKRVVFTSSRDGDLELYTMAFDGSDQRRLTREPGYDGGAFFSPDGTKICFRASRPRTEEELKTYRELLAQELVEPSRMEIFICNADGGGMRQVTQLGAASFCPFFHPSGEKIIFASNHHMEGPRRRNFDLFLVGLDGGGLERLTFDESFDGFPMFSPDGRKLVWCSNRHAERPGDTNVFIADWAD